MFSTNVNVASLRPIVAMKMILRCLKFDVLASRSDVMVSFRGRFKKYGKRKCISHIFQSETAFANKIKTF